MVVQAGASNSKCPYGNLWLNRPSPTVQDLKTKFTDTDSKWVEMILDEMSLHGEERDREAAREPLIQPSLSLSQSVKKIGIRKLIRQGLADASLRKSDVANS